MATIKTDDTKFGSAANGVQTGAGYDCTIRRESATTAVVNLTTPDGRGDWLFEIQVAPEQNLQAEAIAIGENPASWMFEGTDSDGADWDDMVERWNALLQTA